MAHTCAMDGDRNTTLRAAAHALIRLLLSFQHQMATNFFVFVQAALTIFNEHEGFATAAILSELPMPFDDDYSNQIVFDGLPIDTALLIQCAVRAELCWNPCHFLHNLVQQIDYSQFASRAAGDILLSVCTRAGRRRAGCIFDMVKNFKLLRYSHPSIRWLHVHAGEGRNRVMCSP